MSISLDELKHLADLARLRLSDGEFDAMQSDLNRVLDHFEQLRSLDLTGIEFATHATGLRSIWRDDIPILGIERAAALFGAPEVQAGLFLVPTIIDD
ncbi:MAG: Asp-tRNA(Asn)/Glu-tRNA(Gln) amidotransferase subunit GatC [Armatimonadota bacterium]|nr:Asp-tRNA(Asn)/Glu-tRNA(Gln) amidotransferase subunit GatC [Armatimonadota bacterium]